MPTERHLCHLLPAAPRPAAGLNLLAMAEALREAGRMMEEAGSKVAGAVEAAREKAAEVSGAAGTPGYVQPAWADQGAKYPGTKASAGAWEATNPELLLPGLALRCASSWVFQPQVPRGSVRP